jgi:hypothetical protein
VAETLRPMNLGGILDRGVQVYRAQYLVFFGLGSIPGLAALGEQLALVHPKTVTDPTGSHVALVAASYGASFVFWVATLVLQVMATAAVCLAASRVNLGEPINIRSAFGPFISKSGRLVGIGFLQGLYAGWPFIFAIILASVLSISVGSASNLLFVMTPVYILGAIPCIALYTRYALAYPATAIENLPAHAAIQRSIGLSEGGRWRICWGYLVPLVPSFMLTAGAAGLAQMLKTHSALLAGNPIVVAGTTGVVYLIAALVFQPYSAIVLTLLYYDQRIRREGYDVERMMETAGMNTDATRAAGDGSMAQVAVEEGQA